jgi:gamma-glutamylputrescine oxidase
MPNALPPSYFKLAASDIPQYPSLDGSRKTDVLIVGGGFTGLSAALHLAEAGVDVVLIEADSIATGASGRNGGQIHSGLRRDVIWLEKKFGFERAKTFWDLSEEAKALIRSLVIRFTIPCDLRAGVIETQHKQSYMKDAAELVETLHHRFGYEQAQLLGREEIIAALGSERFFGGIDDRGGGHLDPYRFSIGLARAAASLGATIHEHTPALSLESGPVVRTKSGDIRAEHVIVATDGRSGSFEQITRRRMVGLNSFIVVTEPLGILGDTIMPGGQSAADSRFVVRYWRKTADGRLVFGGGESNAGTVPSDLHAFVRPHLLEIYPQLAGVPIVHGWSGIVSVTAPRLPFVREIAPSVWAAGGYSGQGVALAPFIGKLLAEAVQGQTDRISAFTELPIPTLPLATWLRRSLVTLALWRGRLADRL